MSEQLVMFTVEAPFMVVGTVMGELSRRGGWLKHMSHDDHVAIVKAAVEPQRMADFGDWLHSVSEGQGRFTVGDPVASEDA